VSGAPKNSCEQLNRRCAAAWRALYPICGLFILAHSKPGAYKMTMRHRARPSVAASGSAAIKAQSRRESQNEMNYPINRVSIDLLGRKREFFGDLGDEYFRNLGAYAAQNDLLVKIATKTRSLSHSTFLDVGANIGATASMVRLIHPDANIVCLEPSPKAFHYLQKNADPHMRLFNVAAGRQEGVVDFYEADFLAGSSLNKKLDGYDDQRKTIPVEISSLDRLCADHDIRDVKLVKIDVEGFEFDVLKGAEAIIKRDDPVFVCEFNSYAIAANGKESPYSLLELILATFGEFFSYRNGVSTRIDNDKDARDFFYQNMVMQGCVEDIYFGSKSEPL
jgi:FkbM family methyltransferase